jgi:hypothetical protein
MTKTTLACVLVLAAAGCGVVQPARMALPDGLQARTEETRIEGLGAGTSGTLRVAGNSGPFTRAASQLALFDVASFDRGGSTFTVSGADFPSPVSARCRFRQNTVTLGIVDFNPKKMAYECDFDGLPGARLSLQETVAGGDVRTMQAERRGQITVNGKVLALRSVHDIEGAVLPVASPIGYVLESGSQPVAAVELNGTVPQLRLPDATQPELRRSVLLAAIAVSLLWDPAAR